MNNQTSINSVKFITGLLENPSSLADGDQGSVAMFRQWFPYFIPARYFSALESHRKDPYSNEMMSNIKPYLGNWILFSSFLERGLQVEQPATITEQALPEPPEQALEQTFARSNVSDAIPVADTVPVFEPPAPQAAIELIVPDVHPSTEWNQSFQTWASDLLLEEETNDHVMPDEAREYSPIAPEPAYHEVIAPITMVIEPQPFVPVPQMEEHEPQIEEHEPQMNEPEPQPNAPEREWKISEVQPKEEPAEIAALPEIPVTHFPAYVFAAPVPEPEPHILFQDAYPVPVFADAVAETENEKTEISKSVFGIVSGKNIIAKEIELHGENTEWSPELQQQAIVPDNAIKQQQNEIWPADPGNETQMELTVDTGTIGFVAGTDNLPTPTDADTSMLFAPLYTEDYFLHQGIPVSPKLSTGISSLTPAEIKDKSLMVMMSFSEWLMHFKNTSHKQKEEKKDQRSLKTMWQKEKLAAAIEEENEEIPENVFEMAVNSITKEDGLASETLADIYIKQGKYDKAIEMYRKLSLRNPKKNAYFARKIEEVSKEKQI